MNEQDILKRKIKLKQQALFLIRKEVERHRLESALLKVRQFFEQQIDHAKDQKQLSRQIDMIETLLEALREA